MSEKPREQMPTWRRMTAADLETVNRIADEIHTGLPERPEVFADKLRHCPEGCLTLEFQGAIVGYGFSHPWQLNEIPPLDGFLGLLPSAPTCLYVHDVVVRPIQRGHGSAGRYIELMTDLAKRSHVGALALVSVYDTHPLWAKYGFKIVNSESLVQKLKSYGDTAKYMVNELDH
jgi:Acetyltransferase (GNAT) family